MEPEHFGRVARLLERSRAGRDRDGRPGPLHRGRPHAVEHDRRDPGQRPEGRGRHARRPPRLLARRDRRDRQRRGLGRGHGGHAHPQGGRRQAPADDSHRPLERRGAGRVRIAGLRLAALRVAARAFGGGKGQALLPPQENRSAHRQARAREAVRVLQPRQWQRKDSRDLLRGQRRGRPDLPGMARSLSPISGRRS